MKPFSSSFAATCLTVLLALTPTLSRADDEDKTPLAMQMSGIAKDYRALHKQITDPAQKDASIKLIRDMEDHATKARALEPAKTKTVSPADKAQFIADYQKQIDALIAAFKKVEGQLNDGKFADASASLDETQALKREGHKKFIVKKDEK